jgi:hypothetical protein
MRDVRRDSFAVMQDIVVFGGGCSVLSETLESSKLPRVFHTYYHTPNQSFLRPAV